MGANTTVYRCVLVILIVCCAEVKGPRHLGGWCLSLSSSSRWIIDEDTGGRVKLACVNWAAHLTPMLAEGLHTRPVSCIVQTIARWGFNCVRLTWATFMFTNATLANQTVATTFMSLKLNNSLAGIAKHNPGFLNLTTIQALQAVASELGKQGIMVILDNQMSRPGWCCAEKDGNGFFGDWDFAVDEWVRGLKMVASAFQDNIHVVGMSLRNELRGPRQNVPDWYRYMQQGGLAIHAVNPRLLIIHGGLSYAQNLRFLKSHSLSEVYPSSLQRKVVYELHRYSFTNGDSYATSVLDHKCASVMAQIMAASAFVASVPSVNDSCSGPLFVSEFGVELTGDNANDNHFLPCFTAFLAEHDFDWALWALQGSYYLREGEENMDESYGLMNRAWNGPRNGSILRRIQALQKPLLQDIHDFPTTGQRQVIFHPSTGFCINSLSTQSLTLGPCSIQYTWSFTGNRTIVLDGTHQSIVSQGNDTLAMLARINDTAAVEGSVWRNNFTATRMQLATTVGKTTLCLDGGSSPSIYTRQCICRRKTECEDVSGQWFKFINITTTSDDPKISSL